MRKLLPGLIWGVVLLICAACTEQNLPDGVVALVDGVPIQLRTVQALQDTRTAEMGVFEKPALSTLRQQYGAALCTLIVQTLVEQELQRLRMPVTESDVETEEASIRQDYPDEEFEQHLRENALDLDDWRVLTRLRMSMEVFATRVLRPVVAVALPEVENWYETHQKDFVVPRLLTLWQVSGLDRMLLEEARARGSVPDASPDVRTYRFSVQQSAVPEPWKKLVAALKQGEATPVRVTEQGFEYVLLAEDSAEQTLDLVQAYPYIEQMLLEEKTEQAFQDWLEKRLSRARILVSTHLAEELRGVAVR